MKLYDISQEVFGCAVYPGDPSPQKETLCAIAQGDLYNLTAFSMCAHNGTHIDAPYHFLQDGKTVEQLALTKTVGPAYVISHDGMLGAEDAARMLTTARQRHTQAAQRLLIKGDAIVSAEAAEVFAGSGVDLIGNEAQSVGPEEAPMAVHKILLGANVVLLEGIRLRHVPDGVYWLSAAPLALSGADGAPCRAILAEFPV